MEDHSPGIRQGQSLGVSLHIMNFNFFLKSIKVINSFQRIRNTSPLSYCIIRSRMQNVVSSKWWQVVVIRGSRSGEIIMDITHWAEVCTEGRRKKTIMVLIDEK